jgi:hypothetical protein
VARRTRLTGRDQPHRPPPLARDVRPPSQHTIATAISETSAITPEIARPQGIALAGVFQIIIIEAGQRTLDGQTQHQIADELHPAIDAVLHDLDRWLAPAAN